MKTYMIKYEHDFLEYSKLWLNKTVLVQANDICEALRVALNTIEPNRILEVTYSSLEIVK